MMMASVARIMRVMKIDLLEADFSKILSLLVLELVSAKIVLTVV